MTSDDFNRELTTDMGIFSRDPLKWVLYSFPWGQGELSNFSGPEPWQRDLLAYVRDNLSPNRVTRVAVASGHGIGKSTMVAWLILWALSTCPDTKGVVTANTGTQLRTKTWSELAKWHNRFIASHWFERAMTSISSRQSGHEELWRVDSIVWSKHSPEAFAGLHNMGKRIILIFDEASAIEDMIWEVSEGALTDEDTEILWLAFGNPTRNTGRFRECYRKYRDLWHHIHVDSRSVDITNKRQIQEWIDTYGEDSDFVKIRVTGQFPDTSEYQLIGVDLVRAAMDRRLTDNDVVHAPKILGVDVAGTGADSSAVWLRQGLYARRLYKRNEPDTEVFAGVVASLIKEHKPAAVFIDMGAMGVSILDKLRHLAFDDIVHGVYFQGKALRDDLYVNRRSEMWHEVQKWLKDGGALPGPGKATESQDIEDDLISPEYFYTPKGKMQLESKEDMKARGLPSPDDGDALALTFAAPVQAQFSPNAQANNVNAEISRAWKNYSPIRKSIRNA